MEEIEIVMARLEEKITAIDGRLHIVEKDRSLMTEMQKSLAVLSSQQSQLMNKIDSLNAKVDELERKPAKRWDALVTAIIGAVVGVVIGILIH